MNDNLPTDRSKYELAGGKTSTLGLDYNMAAAVCYLPIPMFPFIAAVLWLLTEPKANLFVRFHAIQALMFSVAFAAVLVVVSIIGSLSAIPVIGIAFAIISGLAWFAACVVWFIGSIVLMLKAKEREMYKLPYIGNLAEKYAT